MDALDRPPVTDDGSYVGQVEAVTSTAQPPPPGRASAEGQGAEEDGDEEDGDEDDEDDESGEDDDELRAVLGY